MDPAHGVSYDGTRRIDLHDEALGNAETCRIETYRWSRFLESKLRGIVAEPEEIDLPGPNDITTYLTRPATRRYSFETDFRELDEGRPTTRTIDIQRYQTGTPERPKTYVRVRYERHGRDQNNSQTITIDSGSQTITIQQPTGEPIIITYPLSQPYKESEYCRELEEINKELLPVLSYPAVREARIATTLWQDQINAQLARAGIQPIPNPPPNTTRYEFGSRFMHKRLGHLHKYHVSIERQADGTLVRSSFTVNRFPDSKNSRVVTVEVKNLVITILYDGEDPDIICYDPSQPYSASEYRRTLDWFLNELHDDLQHLEE